MSYILTQADVFTEPEMLQMSPFIQQIFIEQLLRAVSSIGGYRGK